MSRIETGGTTRKATRGNSCVSRGFHGPFALDRSGGTAEKEFATCVACGSRVATEEHLAAYQIALFHGLVR